jgi:hypothetical protein
MTEKQVQLLGFQKEILFGYDDEENDGAYYYALDIVDGLSFITPASDEVKDDNWYVEIFNTDPHVRFDKFEDTQTLLNKLTKAIVKK